MLHKTATSSIAILRWKRVRGGCVPCGIPEALI
jgi:hypothetical protein